MLHLYPTPRLVILVLFGLPTVTSFSVANAGSITGGIYDGTAVIDIAALCAGQNPCDKLGFGGSKDFQDRWWIGATSREESGFLSLSARMSVPRWGDISVTGARSDSFTIAGGSGFVRLFGEVTGVLATSSGGSGLMYWTVNDFGSVALVTGRLTSDNGVHQYSYDVPYSDGDTILSTISGRLFLESGPGTDENSIRMAFSLTGAQIFDFGSQQRFDIVNPAGQAVVIPEPSLAIPSGLGILAIYFARRSRMTGSG